MVEAHFSSPFISAFFERVALVTGCVSQETSAKSQEVHVISLISPHPPTNAEVTLHIRPNSNTGTESVNNSDNTAVYFANCSPSLLGSNGNMSIVLKSELKAVSKH